MGPHVRTQVHFKFERQGAAPVRRSGFEAHEALIKNQFFRKRLVEGGAENTVLLQEPVSLEFGKGAHAIHQACMKDWRALRQLGHDGIAIEYYCFDRFAISAHERLIRQWHHLQEPSYAHLATECTVDELHMMEWVLVQGCAAHDAQSAFRWGMGADLKDRDLLRDVYIAIESLRNSTDLLIRYAVQWVALRMTFTDPMPDIEIAERLELWEQLGLEPGLADHLARVLQLRFVGGDCCFAKIAKIWLASWTWCSIRCSLCSSSASGVSRGG